MLCSRHGVRLCMDSREPRAECEPKNIRADGGLNTDWSWKCSTNKSCWEKFHEFYQPAGLFNNYFIVDKEKKKCKFAQYSYSSSLYMQKYKALGININRKRTKVQKEEVNTIEDDEEEN
jgi:hypothetical protein